MEPVIVVTHARPLRLEARQLEQPQGSPPETVALGYYVGDHLIARGLVAASAVGTLRSLLSDPVTLALAADEDDEGNIDARVCIVVQLERPPAEDAEPAEPWRESVPSPPFESSDPPPPDQGGLALVPLGEVVRSARNRTHEHLAGDVRDMLSNLLDGRARDAVQRAIDDLLSSI